MSATDAGTSVADLVRVLCGTDRVLFAAPTDTDTTVQDQRTLGQLSRAAANATLASNAAANTQRLPAIILVLIVCRPRAERRRIKAFEKRVPFQETGFTSPIQRRRVRAACWTEWRCYRRCVVH